MADKVEAKASLDAETALVNGALLIALNLDDFISAHAQIYGAADAAVSADSFDLSRRLFSAFGKQSSRGTPGDALTAGFTD